MMFRRVVSFVAIVFWTLTLTAQQRGSLFIIGGGERSEALLRDMVNTSNAAPDEYFVILPMASGVPDETVEMISGQLAAVCKNPVRSFNFTRQQADDADRWIDSVRHAKLIYITGGDQNRFMAVVAGSKLYDALHDAYQRGATIAGTSAGAAIMSEIMITGDEADKADKGFKTIRQGNVITSQGMGFLSTVIIDQHFIRRSRYNRLISVLGDHPGKTVIGIDESTALVVTGRKARVSGDGQVVVISRPRRLQVSADKKFGFRNASLSLYLAGDHFTIRNH